MTCMRRETYLADFISCGDCTGFDLHSCKKEVLKFPRTPLFSAEEPPDCFLSLRVFTIRGH